MKRVLIPLLTAVLAPAVLAQEQGIFDSAFSLIFGSVSGSPANDLVLKAGLWLALILVLFQGAQKIFKSKDATGNEVPNKKIAIIFAIIISTIAVRFMPPFIAEGLGALTWIAALILLPYTLVSFVTDNKWAKIIATGLFVIITWALFSSYGAPFVFPYIRGSEFFSDLYYLLTPQSYLFPIIAAGVILILLLIFFAGKGAAPGDGSGGGSKGGFWDYWAARKAAKAAVKQEKIQAKAAKKQARIQAGATKEQARQQARAAIEQARINAPKKPGFWERRRMAKAARPPGLIKSLLRGLGEKAIKDITTPKSPEVRIAEIKARAAIEQARINAPKKPGFWERRRLAKAAQEAARQARGQNAPNQAGPNAPKNFPPPREPTAVRTKNMPSTRPEPTHPESAQELVGERLREFRNINLPKKPIGRNITGLKGSTANIGLGKRGRHNMRRKPLGQNRPKLQGRY